MNQYEIDMAIESLIDDMDMYDYATEASVAYYAGAAVGAYLGKIDSELYILRRDAKRIPRLTDEAIKSKNPKKIKRIIRMIYNDVEMADKGKNDPLVKPFSKPYQQRAEDIKAVAKECLPKLEKALKQMGDDWTFASENKPKNPPMKHLGDMTKEAIYSGDPKKIRHAIKYLEKSSTSDAPPNVKKMINVLKTNLEKELRKY